MISVTIQSANAAEFQAELQRLLDGARVSFSPSTIDAVAATSQSNEPPRMTAAQKKAAAKEAAEKAAAETKVDADPEADKQDAADEAAESAATKPVDLTHDDVKKLLGGYVQAYGMAATQQDGVGFIGAPKISEIPNTQAALAAAIIRLAQAIEKNPNQRDVSGDGITPEKLAELKPIVAAALAVK